MTFKGYIDIYASFQLASPEERDKAVEEIFMVFKNGFTKAQQIEFLKMMSPTNIKNALQLMSDKEQVTLMKELTESVKLRSLDDFDLILELDRRGYNVGLDRKDNTIKFDKEDGE